MMSAVNNENSAARKPSVRSATQRNNEGQRPKRKAAGTNRGLNSSGTGSGASNRQKQTGTNQNNSQSAQTANNGSSTRTKQRPGTQRQGDRTARKSAGGAKPPKQPGAQKNAHDSDAFAAGSGPGPDSLGLDNFGVSDPFLASISSPVSIPKQSADELQSYTPEQIAAAGPVYPDPSALGFMRSLREAAPRPVPRYMIQQPRLLVAPHIPQNQWDKENQKKMIHMENANGGMDFQGIYEEFQKMREVERKKMEELGLVDAENITKDLHDAIVFQGTCPDMCPTFERVRRSLENNVKNLEKDPVTQRISRDRAIKAFSRPAAGQPPPMPSDVRPPQVLMKTLDYIVDSVLPEMPEAHSFIWDRTRSIRQDFVYQNYYGSEAIDCNERIVRIHLLSLHIMAGSDVEFSQQQELEQFNKALQTLTESYLDVRNHGGTCPNEAEFRAYHLISHFRDAELEREVQNLPTNILTSNEVQLALRFRTLMSQNNVVERGYTNKIGAVNLFVEFFRLTYSETTPLLLACLLETHFNEIRFYALKSLSRAYHTKGKAFSAESLRQMLGFDTLLKLTEFVKYYDIDTLEENGELLVDLCNKEKLESVYKLNSLQDKPARPPAFSPQIDFRLKRYKLQNLVNSGRSNADLHLDKTRINTVLDRITNRHKPNAALVAGPKESQKAFDISLGSSRNATLSPQKNPTPFGRNPVASDQAPHGQTPFGQAPQGQTSFGQVTPTPPGQLAPTQTIFGLNNSSGIPQNFAASQPAQGTSLNRSDFVHNKKATTGLAQTTFGQPSSSPSFDFTANAKPPTSSPAVVIKDEPKPSNLKSTADALPGVNPEPSKSSFSKPTFPLGNTVGHLLDATYGTNKGGEEGKQSGVFNFSDLQKPKEEKNKLKNDAFENKNVLSVGQKDGSTALTSTPKPPVSLIPNSLQTGEKHPKNAKNHKSYEAAVTALFNDVLQDTIESEVCRIVSQIAKHQNRVYERSRLIDALAEELYVAFLAEQTHHAMLECVARAHHEKTLKLKYISKVKRVCQEAKQKQDAKNQRKSEVEQMAFKTPSLKRKIINSSRDSSFAKRRPSFNSSKANISMSALSENVGKIQELWQPFALEEFAEKCTKDVKAKLENGPIGLNCIVVAEDWSLPYSKWLNTKFSFKVSDDKTHNTNSIQSGDLTVTFRSLPKASFVNEPVFRSTPFLVFECGLLDQGQVNVHKDLPSKLARDGGILAKIVQICDRFSYYRVQILVLTWDITSSGMPLEEQKKLLRVDHLKNTTNCIQNIEVCDMASSSGDVVEEVQTKLFKMAQEFTGQLSKRGASKRLEIHKLATKKVPFAEERETATDDTESVVKTLKAKEEQMLGRAKELQRRRYLSAHATANRSGDLTNVSGTFRTPNGSFAHHTLMNYNNSFLGNNTLMHARDASFLKSFANASVIEESTPIGSPGPKARTAPAPLKGASLAETSFTGATHDKAPLALPKKVQELRDITASIKARFKNSRED